MSVVSTVREVRESRKESPRLDDEPASEAGEGWWSQRAATVRRFVAANPLQLGFPENGTLETIMAQLARGDEFADDTVRRRCWKHLSLELAVLPGWDSANEKPDRTFFKASELNKIEAPPPIPPSPAVTTSSAAPPLSPSPTEVSIQLPPPSPATTLELPAAAVAVAAAAASAKPETDQPAAIDQTEQATQPVTAEQDATETPPEATPAQAPAPAPAAPEVQAAQAPAAPEKPLSQMTMLERQAHWLKKKQSALDAQRAEKEKEDEKFTFKPNTQGSRRSFQPKPRPSIDAAPVSSAPSAPVTNTTTASTGKGKSGGKSRDRRRSLARSASAASQATANSSSGAAAVPQRTSMALRRAASAARLSVAQKRESKRGQDDVAKAAAEAAEGAAQATADGDLESADGHVDSSASEGNPTPREEQDEDKLEDAGNGQCTTATTPADDEAFTPGCFWWKVESGRGYHRVLDGSGFEMWSIYRKKDKTRGVEGVSLMVGRMEQAPYNEKVLQTIFDTNHWTEEKARIWWRQNHTRYESCDRGTGKLMVTYGGATVPPTTAGKAEV